MRRPVLVIGATGQIGGELMRLLPASHEVTAPARDTLDLARPSSIREMVRRLSPAVIVNAAGYTAVDRAESERDLCMAVNAEGSGVLAEAARDVDAVLVHYSTDYVFDGTKTAPYVEGDPPSPINVYGESKLAGENAIRDSGAPHLIVRTSWVYGARGVNFVRTMLRLARERSELRIVNDQTGSPTWSRSVARATVAMLGRILQTSVDEWSGTYHVTAGGSATWYDLAHATLEGDLRRNEQRVQSIVPVTTQEYSAAAARPKFSVLDCTKARERFGVALGDWRDDLTTVLAELA
jgi:dTDP-4-dehydrorhamnose reductase